MTMETTLHIAARLRRLSDSEFDALCRMVEEGDEPLDVMTLAAVCEALADCAEVVRADAAEPRSRHHSRQRNGRIAHV